MKAKRAIIILIVLILTISFCYSLKGNHAPTSQNGVLDLTSWDFKKDGPVLLNGEWEVYLNQFINPDDFENGWNPQPNYIRFPATAKEFEKLEPGSNHVYATFRLRIKMNAFEKKLGLKSYIVLSSYKVFVDDEFKTEIGKVGASKEESLPYYLNSKIFFQKEGDEIEIIYHASDFYLNDLSIRSPLLGLESQIEKQTNYNLAKELFLSGSLFMMGAYHLGLFLKRRQEKAPLFFGLLCLLIALRTLVTGERYLEQILPFPFEVYCKTGYISAFMGLPVFINYIDHTLKHLLSGKAVKTTNYVGIALTFVTLATTQKFYNVFLNPFFIFLALILLYVFIMLLFAYQRRTPYSGLILFGFFAIGISVVNDIIYQNALTSIGSIIPVGVFLFTFTQSYLLASKFTSSFREAEKLTVENRSILLALKELNKNLENKVEERTEALNVLMIELEKSNTDLKASMEQLALEVEEHKKAEKEISTAYEKIELMSKTDYLTKLSNRRDIFERIQKEPLYSTVYSVVLCDIDHFKFVNDTYGHSVGDQVLIKVAEILKGSMGPDDHVARWGGEEFLLLLKNTEGQKAFTMIEQIRKSMEHTNLLENVRINITMTFGICEFDRTISFESCIARADKALYKGKNSGRNQVVLAEK